MIMYIKNIEEWNTALHLHKKNDNLMVVYFGATWCAPCKKLSPQYVSLSQKEKYLYSVQFCKIDIDEINESILEQYSVKSIPLTIILKNGNVIGEIQGNHIENIEEYIIYNL